MVLLECFGTQMRGIMFVREGENVVLVRKPCNMLDPSCMKVGLSQNRCVYIWGVFEDTVASSINPLKILLKNPVKNAVYFCVFCNYYITFTTSR